MRSPTDNGAGVGVRPQRRVLVLAYYFPPLGGGGVQRTLKFVKYLPAEGYDPVVVTVRALAQRVMDPTLNADIPAQATVIRAPEVPLYAAGWGLDSLRRRARLGSRRTPVLGWPDELAGWVPGALVAARRAVRKYRPDVVYSTSSPVSAHLVALHVSRAARLPWVADFRDAWMLNPERPPAFAARSDKLERAIATQARRLVVADQGIEIAGVDSTDPRRVFLPNGVDADDMSAPSDRRFEKGSRFRIAHVGMLYAARDASPVIDALERLVDRGAIGGDQLELRLIGAGRLDRHVQGVAITKHDSVDHHEAISEMESADVLLLYQPTGWSGATGKIYEYLATGRPILCVADPTNNASRLVRELGAGECVDPSDADGLAATIERLYRRWVAGDLATSLEVRDEALRRFSRQSLAHQLAQVFDDACSERPETG